MSEPGTPTAADEVIAARVVIALLMVDDEQLEATFKDLRDTDDYQRVVGVITCLANNLAGAFEQLAGSKEAAIEITRQQLANSLLIAEEETDES